MTYLIGSLIFFYGKSTTMYAISLSYVFVTLGVTLINLKWKISVHAAGISGPSTALVCVFGLAALPVVALIVLVVWARIKLKAHTPWQSIAGAIVGILITLSVYVIFYPLLGPNFL
jgi:membrane-associated phospholipid phosphatase